MKTLNMQSLTSLIRQAAAIAAIVLGSIPATGLPNAVRAPLVAISGILLTVEHYVADPSTGSTPTPPKTTNSAPPPPA